MLLPIIRSISIHKQYHPADLQQAIVNKLESSFVNFAFHY